MTKTYYVTFWYAGCSLVHVRVTCQNKRQIRGILIAQYGRPQIDFKSIQIEEED